MLPQHHTKIFQNFGRDEGTSVTLDGARSLEIAEHGNENPFDSFPHEDHAPVFTQDPTSAGYLAGRASNEKLSSCIELNDSFDSVKGYPTFRSYQVPVPVENTFLSCRTTGSGQGQIQLEMHAYRSAETYCTYYYSLSETSECSVGGPSTGLVDIRVSYFGPPTTLKISCSNEPCTAPVCGDGFCSNELETPLLPTGATGITCQEDCGKACGDGICDARVGENDSNCLSDCGCLYLDEKLFLWFAETRSYEIEV